MRFPFFAWLCRGNAPGACIAAGTALAAAWGSWCEFWWSPQGLSYLSMGGLIAVRRGGACPSCLVSEGFHFTRRVSPCGATSFARGGEGGKTPPGVSRGRLTAPAEPLPDPVYGGYPYTLPQKFRPAVAEGAESGGAPDGAVSINKGRADLGSAPTAAYAWTKK